MNSKMNCDDLQGRALRVPRPVLARELGLDESGVCRVLSGERGLLLSRVPALLAALGLVAVPVEDYRLLVSLGAQYLTERAAALSQHQQRAA